MDSFGTLLNNDQNRSEVRRLRSVIKRRIGDAKVNVKGQRQGYVCVEKEAGREKGEVVYDFRSGLELKHRSSSTAMLNVSKFS